MNEQSGLDSRVHPSQGDMEALREGSSVSASTSWEVGGSGVDGLGYLGSITALVDMAILLYFLWRYFHV